MAVKCDPKVFDFITRSNWTISNIDRRNWIGRWKARGEVNDFILSCIYLIQYSRGSFKKLKGACWIPCQKFLKVRSNRIVRNDWRWMKIFFAYICRPDLNTFIANPAIVTFRGLTLHRKKNSEKLFECTRKNDEWQIWWQAFISEKDKWKQNEKHSSTVFRVKHWSIVIRPKNSSILLFRVKHWFYDG